MSRVPLLRTSERRTFKECPQKWWWSWREGLVPKSRPADHFWFGTGHHLALAEWYIGPGRKRGPHPVETWRAYCAKSGDSGTYIRSIARSADTSAGQYFTEERMVEAAELGEVLLEEYVKLYGRDDHWGVIQPEYSTQINIPHPTKPGEVIVVYCLTYDGVYRDLSTPNGDLFLMEHKTAKSIPNGSHLELDDQAGSYWAVAAQTVVAKGLVPDGTRLRGITYNYLRKALPDARPKDPAGYATNTPTKAHYLNALEPKLGSLQLSKLRVDDLAALAEKHRIPVLGDRSKVQPKPLFERKVVIKSARQRAMQLKKIADEATVMDLMRRREIPLFKTPTSNCSSCQFFDLCTLHDAQAPGWRDFKRDAYRVEDPYAAHRDEVEDES